MATTIKKPENKEYKCGIEHVLVAGKSGQVGKSGAAAPLSAS
jgi:hypothetical protein